MTECVMAWGCFNCPIASANNGTGTECSLFMRRFPEKFERIIMQWAEENPIMTNGKKFEEVFGISGRNIVAINKLAWLEEEYKGGNCNGQTE